MISKVLAYLFNDYNKKTNILFFKRAIYAYVFIRCIVWLVNYNLLFGDPAISLVNNISVSVFKLPAYFLYLSNNALLPLIFIITTMFICAFSVFKKSTIVTDLLLYFLVINIHYKIYTTLTGGDAILNNLLFLGAFARTSFNSPDNFRNSLLKLMHNLSVMALILQVCIIYFYSALVKWFDNDWLNGVALFYVSGTKHFSSWAITELSMSQSLSIALSYLVLFYQSLFPVFLLFKKYKNLFLWCGIIMHLYIVLVMGLVFFGLIMIVCYLLFYEFKKQPLNN